MLIKKESQTFEYVFSTEGLEPKRIKHLMYSSAQRNMNFDGNDDTFAATMSGFFGILCLVEGPVALVMTTGTGPMLGGIGTIVAGALLSLPATNRVKRSLQYRQTQKLAGNRERMINIIGDSSPDSYAFNALMETAFGKETLLPELMCQSITSSQDRDKYLHYVDTNPDNQLFPKLKLEFDAFLAKTTKHDVAITAYEGVGSDSEIARFKTEINQLVVETIERMQAIANEHNAPIEADRQMAIKEKRRTADFELQQIPSLTIYKELPQPL